MKEKLFVKNTITFDAPIEKVWDALTKPEHTKVYMFGTEVDSDWKVGSPVLWKGIADGVEVVYVKGNIISIERGTHLSFTTIAPAEGYVDIPENYTTVTYGLKTDGDATILNVSQGDFAKVPGGEEKYKHTAESWDKALKLLKDLIESEN